MNETAYGSGHDLLVELTADIVAAYVSHHVVPVAELSSLISDVHAALNNTSTPVPLATVVEKQKPAVPISRSINDDYIVC